MMETQNPGSRSGSTVQADRELLVGLMALRRGADPLRLGSAIEAWAATGGGPIGPILVGRGVIPASLLDLLLVDLEGHLRDHDGDLQPGLSALASGLRPGVANGPDLGETLVGLRVESTLAGSTIAQSSSPTPTSVEATVAGTVGPSAIPDDLDLEATAAATRSSARGRDRDRDEDREDVESTVAGTIAPEPGRLVSLADPGGDATVADLGEPRSSTRAGSAAAKAVSRLRYRILRGHAKGGLGEVFLAYDEELNREVALKEIQGRHADDLESRSRFLVEAEVTGRLEHPGIIPVYGLGHYPDGRPYYAMRFIKGDSLKEAIARFHASDERDPGVRILGLRQLLGHFIDVCQAIAYAHARRIVHRDIKPANIMIGAFGETLVVDWGLAKAIDEVDSPSHPPTGEELSALRLVSGGSGEATLAGSVIGTPQYASPEQAAGETERIGPASDVYSLGATLHTLLTGLPPLPDRDVPTLLDRVRRGDIPSPRAANPGVPRPLEAICLKAMALRPEGRYPSAKALATDLEHWLGDEPVSAYREPLVVRAARWARRHKTAVASAAALLITAVSALLVGTVLLERERARTEVNFRLATDAVDALLTEVGEIDLVDVPQMEGVRRRLLDKALGFYYGKFREGNPGDAAYLRLETSRASVRLANIDEMLGDYPSAERRYKDAIAILSDVTAEGSRWAEYRGDLARAEHGLGVLLRKSGRYHEAEASLRRALAIREAMASRHPEDRAVARQTLYDLGALLAKQDGRAAEVEEAYRAAESELATLSGNDPTHLDFRRKRARYLNNMGKFRQASRPAEAQAAFLHAWSIQARAHRDAPGVAGLRWEMARTLNNLGAVARLIDPTDLESPGSCYRAALGFFADLAADFPSVPDYRYEQALALANLASLSIRPGPKPNAESVEGLARLDEAAKLLVGLEAKHPLRPDYGSAEALILRNRGTLAVQTGRPEVASASLDAALDRFRGLVAAYPKVSEYRADLALTYRALASTVLDQPEKAWAALGDAAGHLRMAIDLAGPNATHARSLAGVRVMMGLIAVESRRSVDEAVAAVDEVLTLTPRDGPTGVKAARILAGCARLASTGVSASDPAIAASEGYRARAMDLLREAARAGAIRPGDLEADEFRGLDDVPGFLELRRATGLTPRSA